MNREQLIGKIKNNISLYKNFISPDYPDLNIFASQYLDVLIKYFNDAQKPYSVIYSDVNKLSVVNDRYGKSVGDKTLYTLLRIFNSSFKNNPTVRIGGDEFVTFISNATKQDTKRKLMEVEIGIERQKDYLYGSGITFGIEDSDSGDIQQMIDLADQQVNEQKHKRDKDVFLDQANNSENFVELHIPDGISEEQKEKWEILNKKINILIDNHLRDIRPSNIRFKYKPDHIKKDSKSFIYAFANLLNTPSKNEEENLESVKDDQENSDYSNMTSESAFLMHSLFKGKDVNLENLGDEQLTNLNDSLNTLGTNLIKNKHSGLLGKSYYILYLADKLLDSKQTYQAVYFSISSIRPSNTAYGHSVTDDKIEKTSKLLIEAFESKRSFNNEPFTFDRSDIFFIDQGGGNFLALLPTKQKLTSKEIEQVMTEVNSHCTEDKDSSLKVAYATKNSVNKRTIPLYVNSMAGNRSTIIEWFRNLKIAFMNRSKRINLLGPSSLIMDVNNEKPFVKLSKRLKEDCNNNKDSIKVENLDKSICRDSIESIAQDCISYFYNEIDDSNMIGTQKLLLDNVILALANHESYINSVNEKLLNKKLNERRIIKRKNENNKGIDER